VSGPVFDVHPFAEVDASNIVEELVFVPVCVRLPFYKSLSCVSSDDFWIQTICYAEFSYSGSCKCHQRFIFSPVSYTLG
jgi:hypothetical protein